MNPKQKEQITLAANVEFGRKGAAEMLLLKKVHAVEDSVDAVKAEVANKVDKAHFEATIAQVQTIKGDKGDSVVGPAGKDGSDGKDGVAGKDGAHGNNGVDGKNGVDGQDGHTHTHEELKAIIAPLIPKPIPVVIPEVDVEAIANQFVRSLNGAGAATCNTVSVALDTNLTAASPIVMNGSQVTWSGLGTTTQLSGGTVAAMMNGQTVYSAATSTQTLSAWFSTTGTMGSDVGGTSGTLSRIDTLQFTIGTSTKSLALAGTSTVFIENAMIAETATGVRCSTDVGTADVDLYIGSNHMNYVRSASTTNGFTNITSNGALAIGNLLKADVGTPASSAHYIECTIKVTR